MNIYNFYNQKGWNKKNNISIDAELFEDLRDCAKNYVSRCRNKLHYFIPNKGDNILDFASGPIQYKEYLKYSKNFKYRHCVDFSKKAISEAKKKLNKRGKYYCKDFMKINFKKNYFDCSISLHTIYHINKNKQKKAVKKLIDITKKNKPVIIVYSNPNTLINKFKNLINFKNSKKQKIYFYCHDIDWWSQFKKYGEVKIYPWRSFSSQHQKFIIPNNFIGKFLFWILIKLENNFENFFVNNFQYYTVVIKKNYQTTFIK